MARTDDWLLTDCSSSAAAVSAILQRTSGCERKPGQLDVSLVSVESGEEIFAGHVDAGFVHILEADHHLREYASGCRYMERADRGDFAVRTQAQQRAFARRRA